MDELTCPQCQGTMAVVTFGHVSVRRCNDCSGVFLARPDLGALIEAETDWHTYQSPNTATLPRITPGMSTPPSAPERSRAFVETLFKS